MLRAPITADPSLVAPSARDEFTQAAGALTGKTLPVGGTWAGAGDATDLSVVASTPFYAERTAVSDTEPHYALAGTATPSNIAVQVDCFQSGETVAMGVFARYVDTSNYLRCYATNTSLGIDKVVATVSTSLGSAALTGSTFTDYMTIRLVVCAAGRFWVWAFAQDGHHGEPIVIGQDAALATGGALDDGRFGIFDWQPGGTAATRRYDNFQAWVPVQDAVLHPSQSAELRWDGMYREDSTGTAYGPVSHVIGDLPRLPPTVEGSTTEVFIKVSRGDFETVADDGIDDLSARITYRPCWLTVPGA